MNLIYRLATYPLILSLVVLGTDIDLLRDFAYGAAALYIVVHAVVLASSRGGIGLSKTAMFGLIFAIYVVLRAQDMEGLLAAVYAGVFASLATLTQPKGIKASGLEYPFYFSYGVALGAGMLAYVSPSFFLNPNYTTVIVAFLALPLILRKKSWLLALPIIYFVLIFGARSVLIGILIAYGLYFVARRFSRKSALVVFSICVVAGAIGIAYLWEFIVANSTILDEESLRLTGKRIQSGRTELWLDIFADMDPGEWVFGTGYSYAQLYSTLGVSEHSSYVYTIYRFGLFGLAALFAVLLSILARLWSNGHYVAFVASFAMIIRDFFELTIVANNFAIAIFFWLLCTTGLFDTSEVKAPWQSKKNRAMPYRGPTLRNA